MRRFAPALLIALGLGCSSDEAPTVDAGTPDAGFDAGLPADAGAAADAGFAPDAEVASDAGSPDANAPDAAPVDAGFQPDAQVPVDAGAPSSTPVRVVAANLTSGNFQNYDPGHGLRILEALAPDVVLIQELNYRNDNDPDFRDLTDQVCGASCEWVRGETGSIPNGVISRWPVLASGTWDDSEVGNRGFTWARIDIPGDVDLWAVSLHLLTRNAGTRNREATELVGYIQAQVPPGDYLLVGGDLNTDSRGEGALQTLSAVVRTDGVPADRNGNGGTNASRSKPYDWVLADMDLEQHEVAVELAGQRFAEGLVFDTRVFQPLSAVPPAELGDSDARQMQHMAVVRDFLVPE